MSSDDLDPVFKAIADARRRRMLDLLKERPRTTGELTAAFEDELDRTTVLQHLRVLEDAGLIVGVRRGRHRWNYLNAIPIQEIHDRWVGEYAAGAGKLLRRLREALEE